MADGTSSVDGPGDALAAIVAICKLADTMETPWRPTVSEQYPGMNICLEL